MSVDPLSEVPVSAGGLLSTPGIEKSGGGGVGSGVGSTVTVLVGGESDAASSCANAVATGENTKETTIARLRAFVSIELCNRHKENEARINAYRTLRLYTQQKHTLLRIRVC